MRDATSGELSETEARIARLREEHRMLERRLDQLNRHAYLTPTEAMEVSRIKKEKLWKKDMIQLLQARGGSQVTS